MIRHLALFSFVLSQCAAHSKAAAGPPGLYVHDGVLMHGGQPYHGVGINYFSVFSRLIENPNDDSSLNSLKRLQAAGIPFVRFMACGFWPRDWRLYQTDPDEYFRRLDLVVRAAEEAHIGLIPSLFWHYPTVPDLVSDPIDQLGRRDSKTTRFIHKYIEQVVTRYKDSSAIWGWEFGNEYSLSADLPNAATQRPQVVAELGTPKIRSAHDELSSAVLNDAFIDFAKEVRKYDASRMITSGNAIPRQSAWHNTREKSWKPDDARQSIEILLRDNPDPLDTLSVHIYPDADSKYPAHCKDIPTLMHFLAAAAREAKKPLFIGEFGPLPRAGEDVAMQRKAIEQILQSIERENVPLAALWVFDLESQDGIFNVTFKNSRGGFIEMIAESNRRMGKGNDGE
jgi:hypothetical protein